MFSLYRLRSGKAYIATLNWPLPLAFATMAPSTSLPGGRGRAAGTQIRSEDFTRFERARILGARALQISLGAPLLVETPAGLIDPVEIAELEFGAGVIPITVRRAPRDQ